MNTLDLDMYFVTNNIKPFLKSLKYYNEIIQIMGKDKDEPKSNVTVKETGSTTTTMAQEAGTTKTEAENLGVNVQQRHALELYQSYAKQAADSNDQAQKEALEKLRDEWKAKAGL